MVEHKDTYKTVVNHYLSQKRKDDVKTQWEEPFSSRVIRLSIERLEKAVSPKILRVIDFGCGIGEGFLQIQNALTNLGLGGKEVFYLGVDNSLEMVKVAQEKWEGVPNVDFQQLDFRYNIPEQSADIYFSCGVPYSHLTPEEIQVTLENIFKAIKQNQSQSIVMIDVLGRYSIEWISQWNLDRWPYRMSFLADGDHKEPAMMTCYYAPELEHKIHEAATKIGCDLNSIEFFDRSIMVGRHTSTQEYNSSIPPYRELINGLYRPDIKTDFKELCFQSEVPESAPAPVKKFFGDFAGQWNCLVAEAAQCCGEKLEVGSDVTLPDCVSEFAQELSLLREEFHQQPSNDSEQFCTNVVEPLLAEYLRKLEIEAQPCLGVSHTLIAVVHANGCDKDVAK